METGNYEYRLVLRCRQEARKQFAKMRADALVKIELLDNKHVQDTVIQLQKFISAVATLYTKCYDVVQETTVFPIEVDLFEHTFNYNTTGQINDGISDEEEEDYSFAGSRDATAVDGGVISAPNDLPALQAGLATNNGDSVVSDLLDLDIGGAVPSGDGLNDLSGVERGVEAVENDDFHRITPETPASTAEQLADDVDLLDLN